MEEAIRGMTPHEFNHAVRGISTNDKGRLPSTLANALAAEGLAQAFEIAINGRIGSEGSDRPSDRELKNLWDIHKDWLTGLKWDAATYEKNVHACSCRSS